jgi:nitronate monooxygenase
MNSLRSQLRRVLPWTTQPLIIGAPMRVLAGPDLALAVSSAGGLGFIGPNAATQRMRPDFEEARNLLHEKFPKLYQHSQSTKLLPIGAGFQCWTDDLGEATTLIETMRPTVAWLFAPEDEAHDLPHWSSELRRASPHTQIWWQIGTMAEAIRLAQSSHKPDVVVVQGAESGGHGRSEDGIGLITLLPEVLDHFRKQGLNIPVLAAGGIVDGRGAAAALCLGASGIVMGTRFLASSEARISKGYQQEIIRASDGAANTTRTQLYNHLRGTFGWPKQYSPRTIINRSFIEHQEGKSFEHLQKHHDEAAEKGDEGWGPEGRLATYAGASIGLINEVKPAGDIVRNVQQEMQSILGSLQINDEGKSSKL